MRHYSKGEAYYVYNSSVGKQKMFQDKEDLSRFLFLILYFQSPLTFTNLSRPTKRFLEKGRFGIKKDLRVNVARQRTVELLHFCLMPREFHLVILNRRDKALSKYMQRIQNSYAKYFNTKYGLHGHVFSGTFKAKEIEDFDALLHISSYIYKAPQEIKMWEQTYSTYPWSSFRDYHETNRWGHLLKTSYILDQFPTKSLYEQYITTSLPRKDIKEMLGL